MRRKRVAIVGPQSAYGLQVSRKPNAFLASTQYRLPVMLRYRVNSQSRRPVGLVIQVKVTPGPPQFDVASINS